LISPSASAIDDTPMPARINDAPPVNGANTTPKMVSIMPRVRAAFAFAIASRSVWICELSSLI
jgi:hypothetical protein